MQLEEHPNPQQHLEEERKQKKGGGGEAICKQVNLKFCLNYIFLCVQTCRLSRAHKQRSEFNSQENQFSSFCCVCTELRLAAQLQMSFPFEASHYQHLSHCWH